MHLEFEIGPIESLQMYIGMGNIVANPQSLVEEKDSCLNDQAT